MTRKDVIKRNVDFVDNSGVDIHVVSILGHVLIKDNQGGEVFLQGDDAAEFISKAWALWHKEGDISMGEAYKFFAYDYVDLLEG